MFFFNSLTLQTRRGKWFPLLSWFDGLGAGSWEHSVEKDSEVLAALCGGARAHVVQRWQL